MKGMDVSLAGEVVTMNMAVRDLFPSHLNESVEKRREYENAQKEEGITKHTYS